jgi:peroxiredoxin
MAVSSFMVPLGTPMPEFALYDVEGVEVRSAGLAGDAVLVAFLSNHCPYVRHIEREFAAAAREFAARGVAVVGISSNDPGIKAEDGADGLRVQITRAGFEFPYLLDITQEVARNFNAACTPDFFLYGADRRLAYRGAFDESRPGKGTAVTGGDLRAAVDGLLTGQPVPGPHRPSLGCSIKWAPGNEPGVVVL